MAKVAVIYDSKYGNTKLAAEAIAEGISEVEGIETVVSRFKEADLDQIAGSNAVLIGSPNHIGKATRGIRKFISKLAKVNLEGKLAAVFDTYVGGEFEKAMKKMEKQIGEEIPHLELITPGLSIKVQGMKGPIVEGELPKCREFGNRIAGQIK
jgi:flavorubredoxin